jgi:outer membrane protein assembly factor BamA
MRLLWMCALLPGLLAAQGRAPAKSAAPAKFPVSNITVEGNRAFTRDQILAIAGLKTGQLAGKPEFEAARDRLVASGAFENVSYRFAAGSGGQGYAATFTVAEIEQVYTVLFEDLHVWPKDLEAALEKKDPLFAHDKLPATQPVIERYSKWIQEYLATQGYQEKVAGSVAPTAGGEYAIIFRPAGNRPSVAQVTFEGNQVIPQNVLREAVAGVGVGSTYSEDSFRQVLNASIRPLYERRGRVRVLFPGLRTERADDVNGLHVFVTVDEGASYEMGKLTIVGSTPIAAEKLLKSVEIKTGDVANLDKVNEGAEAIRKEVRRAGYMDAHVASDRKIDDAKKAVDVMLRVDAGPLYTMGKVEFVGLDLNSEAEMKRSWGLPAGKPYNPDYADGFLKRIREGGYFDNLGETKSAVHMNADHSVDVTLTFKGGNTDGRGGPGGRGGRAY